MQLCDKGKGYPTLVVQVTDPSITFVTGEAGRETTEFVAALNTWEKHKRFVVSQVLKDEKDRAQLSFLEGEDYVFFSFVTNTEQSSEEYFGGRSISENTFHSMTIAVAGHMLFMAHVWL